MISRQRQFLQSLYDAFNRREFEKILSMMKPDVVRASGMEGGFVREILCTRHQSSAQNF